MTHQSSDIAGAVPEGLDIATVVEITQAISSEINRDKLIEALMVTALEHADGNRCLLILSGDVMLIDAEATLVDDTIKVNRRQLPMSAEMLPESIVRHVTRTRESVLLDDARAVSRFSGDRYLLKNLSRSIVCLPLTKQMKLVGLLYMENNQTSCAFTPRSVSVLRVLAAQAAISLENARLYSELQHTEASLAEAQRLTHTGHYNLNISSGMISWSDEIYRIFEFDHGAEITLERVVQRAHPDDRDRIQQFIEQTMKNAGEHSFQHRLVMPDGSIKTLGIIAHAIKDEAGKVCLVGTATDITEATLVQERLRAALVETKLAQSRLEEAQRLVRMGTWVWDLSTNKIICSEEHREIFGFTNEQLNSTYEFSLKTLHPDDRPRIRNIVEEAIRQEKTFSCEFRTVLPDGSIRYVHGQGGPSAMGVNGAKEYIGTILDITERKRQEEERQKLVSLIENSSDFIGYSSTTGHIDYLNSGGRRMVGLEPGEDLSSYQMSDLRGSSDDLRVEDEVLASLSRDGHWEGERVLRNVKTADLIPVLQTIFFVNDAVTKQPIGVATISRDISERKNAEDALRKSQAELGRVARLTTMGELAGSIAHEVSQPLMAIVTNGAACLGWLSGEKVNVEKARHAAEKIVSDGHRAGDVVRSIRELTRKTGPKMSQLDVNEVIEATLDLMRAELRQNGILLETNLCADLNPVNGDRVQLQQVILNLIKNGIEAMEGEKARHVLRVVTRSDDHGALEITISDTGVGLRSGEAERIFEAFYTTKPEGIGLGLSICRSIVESHGGRLWTSPNRPTGSIFFLTLPISANRILPNGTA